MKKIILLFALFVGAYGMQAQNTFPFPSTGNVGIGTTSPSALLEVAGSALLQKSFYQTMPNSGGTANKGGYIARPKGGDFISSVNTQTGSLEIQIPTGGNTRDDMVKFVIDIYEYSTNRSLTVFVGGYIYQGVGGTTWTNGSAQIIGSTAADNYTVRFGDNDTLAAMVANLIEADLLVLLTDQDGLFSSDPREDNNAKLIHHGYVDDKSLDNLASGTKSKIGTGGMTTKILAARKAALSGAHTIIASGRRDNILVDLNNDEDIGTFLQSREVKLAARKKWLADNLKLNGKIYIDNGAKNALIHEGKSLLVAGVTKVTGNFDRVEVIQCINEFGDEILKGIVNYNSEEVKKIIGLSSDKIESVLGYVNESSLIHRNNMIIIQTVRKVND